MVADNSQFILANIVHLGLGLCNLCSAFTILLHFQVSHPILQNLVKLLLHGLAELTNRPHYNSFGE